MDNNIHTRFYSIENIKSNQWSLTFKKQTNDMSTALFGSIYESSLLSGCYVLHNDFIKNSSLLFLCTSVVPIRNYIGSSGNSFPGGLYNLALLFIKCLTKQQHYLQKQDNDNDKAMGFIDIDLDHVYVLDNEAIIYVNPTHIFPLTNNKKNNKYDRLFYLHRPFYCDSLSSPELRSVSLLPSTVSSKSYNYSLAAAVFFILFSRHFDSTNDECKNCLHKIVNTTLYWIMIQYLQNYDNASSSLLVI
jgi:hypothetical protein